MAETFVALLSARLICDLLFQPAWPSARSNYWLLLAAQALGGGLLSLFLIGQWHWLILVAVVVTPILLAGLRDYVWGDTFAAYVIDRTVLTGALLALAAGFPRAMADGHWPTTLAPEHLTWGCQWLLRISGFLVCVWMGGIVVGKAAKPFTDQIDKDKLDGLKNGGKYIGLLERTLIYLFIILDYMEGVGFLLGAKSILRFGEIKVQEDRKVTEYIIIGTFLSFGWGILAAGMTAKTLEVWKP